uniref:PAN2-PAN3 deadenylation complex catalytic subunit PAN2 N-terminal domain-containing protein n=1 Tax=Plectus sambesii TaxID=2011161 RepID=A0A914VMZ4_9BILA
MEMYDQQQVHGEMVDDGGVGGELLLPEGDFALLSHVAVDSTGRFSVSAVSFDPFEELLWAGHTGGRVVSYYGPALEKYTAFQTVPLNSEHMDIRALQAIEPGVLALSSKQLACNRRQGLSHFVHSSMHFIDMHCMHRMPNAPGTLVLGGNQQKMIQLDLETRKEQRLLQITQPNCMLLRSNSKFIFSADTSGSVTLRSLQTLEGVHALQAHQGPISDFDVCGTKLITCGYSPRMGQLSTDRFLRIYDIRTLRPLPPITISIAPSFIRFLPSYSDSRIVIASDVGEFQVFEIGANGIFPCQIDTQGSALFCLDSSPTKQCLAFGDAAGYVHLFSDRAEPVLNEEAWPTEFADAPMPVPTISFDDSLAPLAIIPLPFSADGEYLSDLPPELCKRVYR